LGCGLAAVRRAATRFDIHSQPGAGTVVLAVLEPEHHDGAPWPAPPRPWAGVSIGIEEPCGDAWGVSTVDDGLVIALSDGLGHGPHASLASDVALDCLARLPDDLEGYLTKANTALRETRGTVLAVCRLYPERHQLECLSVGNITGRIYHGSQQQSLVPFNGTLGMHATPPRVKVMQYPWPPGATLVLWSDGLTSRADLRDGTDLLRHDPAVVAAAAHRDHTRNRDDATVVVAHHLVT
ncbi:MAG TPA: SpoIIE family protein phosphatase, partial [Rugosimonospora sp.]|nr:SpoIIE family protein phosphatase [Rugosimonospora sp.]